MSAAASTASYISPRKDYEKHPPSPWEYHRGRKPFMHYSTPKSPSARRNRSLGRVMVCFFALVVFGFAMRGWFGRCKGQSCLPRTGFLSSQSSPYVGGGAVIQDNPALTTAGESQDDTVMMLIPANSPNGGAFDGIAHDNADGNQDTSIMSTIGSDDAQFSTGEVSQVQVYGDVSGGDAVVVQDSGEGKSEEGATPERELAKQEEVQMDEIKVEGGETG